MGINIMKQTKRTMAQEIVTSVFESGVSNPRSASIEQIQKRCKFSECGARTYYGDALNLMLHAETKEALERAEKGRRVWSVVKLKTKATAPAVSSVGLFCTKKAAVNFNNTFNYDGVLGGIVEKDDLVDIEAA